MEFSHELVLPNEDLPFRMFLFEGKDGNYVREKHWHRSIEMFVVLEGKLDFYINEDTAWLRRAVSWVVNIVVVLACAWFLVYGYGGPGGNLRQFHATGFRRGRCGAYGPDHLCGEASQVF
mgnify:CR=1 FL=1